MVVITIALPGPHDTAKSIQLDIPEGTKALQLREKLNQDLNANVKLIGHKKGYNVTLNDSEKLPPRIIVNGVTSLTGFSWGIVTNKVTLDFDKAYELQTKLRQEFGDAAFARKLEALEQKYGDKKTSQYRHEFQTLLRSVQFKVLPEFGFSADNNGVSHMMSAMASHMDDAKFAEQGKVINDMLGLPNEINQRPSKPKAEVGESFTKARAMALQRELYAGFTTEEFEEKLTRLHQMHPGGTGKDYSLGLREICLEVQKEVLPKYGFPGNQSGVWKMMSAFNIFMQDEEILNMTDEINNVLGVTRPGAKTVTDSSWYDGLSPEDEAALIRN